MNKLSIKKQLGGRLRRTLWMACAALCAAPSLQAQTEFATDSYEPIPKRFTNSGRAQIVFVMDDAKALQVCDEDLLQLKRITLSTDTKYFSKNRRVTQVRKPIEGIYETKVFQWETTVDDLNEVINIAQNEGCSSHTKKGSVHTFQPIEIPEVPGMTYIRFVYTEEDLKLTRYEICLQQRYGDWEDVEVKDETYGRNPFINAVDYNENIEYEACNWFVTQNLFNKDDKYEYFQKVYRLNTERADTNNVDFNYPQNGERFPIKRILTYPTEEVATELLNEDGTVLQTISGSVNNIVLIGDKCYMVAYDYNEDKSTFYEVERKTNSIREAKSMPLRLSPSLARRTDDITVETAPAAASVRREVVVTAADGRLMARQPIPAGETTVRVSAARMTAGVYTFTVVSEGRKLESGRIIVR